MRVYVGLRVRAHGPKARNLTAREGDTGRWNVFYLYYGGRLVRRNADRCPKTLSTLAKVPGAGAAGEVYFSIMVPGTHLRPHCGSTNARIRCHLCLTEARDCWIRVAEHNLQWAAGRC
jgi:aspartyl/asparaginyl beta-hydroxylase (cupin superfamily)